MTGGQVRRRMVPSYLATGGCGIPTRNTLQGLTALCATGVPLGPDHQPGHQSILTLLGQNSLTVAETAAYLDIPVGVCKVLASELIDDGQLRSDGSSKERGGQASKELLERVISGLHALKD